MKRTFTDPTPSACLSNVNEHPRRSERHREGQSSPRDLRVTAKRPRVPHDPGSARAAATRELGLYRREKRGQRAPRRPANSAFTAPRKAGSITRSAAVNAIAFAAAIIDAWPRSLAAHKANAR